MTSESAVRDKWLSDTLCLRSNVTEKWRLAQGSCQQLLDYKSETLPIELIEIENVFLPFKWFLMKHLERSLCRETKYQLICLFNWQNKSRGKWNQLNYFALHYKPSFTTRQVQKIPIIKISLQFTVKKNSMSKAMWQKLGRIYYYHYYPGDNCHTRLV